MKKKKFLRVVESLARDQALLVGALDRVTERLAAEPNVIRFATANANWGESGYPTPPPVPPPDDEGTTRSVEISSEAFAKLLHETYRLHANEGLRAPEFYSTRPWNDLPQETRDVLVRVAEDVIGQLAVNGSVAS
jgi:hypothetical protein